MNVIGILKLNCNFLWNKDVLGKKYDVIIDKKNYTLHFPSLPNDWEKREVGERCGISCSLIPPDIINRNKINKEDIIYGCPVNYPDCVSIVSYIAISFESVDSKVAIDSKKLYDNIDEWLDNFYNTIRILSGTINCETDATHKGNDIELFSLQDEKIRYIANSNPIRLCGIIHSEKNSISDTVVQKTIKLLNQNYTLSDSQEYYLLALKNYEIKNYRHCILDCATVVEICIVKRIRRVCEEQGINNIEDILKKCNGIDRKKDLLILLKDGYAFNYEKITKLRNKVIHEAYKPKREETFNCLEETKNIIDTYEPLE